jgi:hypothetical protein
MTRRRCPSFRLALLVGSLGITAACGPHVIGNPPPEEPPVIGNPIPDYDEDGYYSWEDDCDDNNAAVHPGAEELCDDLDNDCDGEVDEEDVCLADADGDGVIASKDCDDHDPAVFPGAIEICDGIDNNCSGVIDDVPTDEACAIDADGDGWFSHEDCDDSDADVHPDAGENCGDLIDNDCDGELDWEDADCELILNG